LLIEALTIDLLRGSNNQSGSGSGVNTISSELGTPNQEHVYGIYTRREGMKPLAADVSFLLYHHTANFG